MGMHGSLGQRAGSSRNVLAGWVQKQRVVSELIEGRIMLFDAANRFRVIDAEERIPRLPAPPVEDLCRTVIGWVYLALSERPERAEVVTGRLETELGLYLSQSANTTATTPLNSPHFSTNCSSVSPLIEPDCL